MASLPPPAGLPPLAPPPELPELPEGAIRAPAWPAWTAPVALLAGFAAALFGAIIIAGVTDINDPPPGAVIAGTVFQDVALILAAILFARLTRRPHARDFGLRGTPFWRAAGWLALAWGAFLLFSVGWVAALGIHEKDKLPDELGADKSTAALVATAILVTVVAPIAEEFFFRGYFFTALRNWRLLRRFRDPFAAAVITGIVFGAIHFGSAPAAFVPPLMFFGFVLCLLYWRTGSLLPGIGLHSLNNSLALGVSESWRGGEILLLMAGALLVCAVLLLPIALRPGLRPRLA
jgi:membrane protease YdiL (CAAX protease family)